MQRAMCVWLPGWPLQRACVAQPELRARPLILYAEEGRGGLRVTDCSSAAAARGVTPGMSLAEAEGIWTVGARRKADQPCFLRHEVERDRESLIRLAEWCQRFSPLVAVEGSDSLLLDITGCAHLFGGERGFVRRVLADFRRCRLRVHVALADTPGAAWGVARYGMTAEAAAVSCHDSRSQERSCAQIVPPGQQEKVLAPLPVEALRLPADVIATLHELELRRIGQLLRLPRASLPARFSPGILERLDQALGRIPETLIPVRPQVPVAAEWTFPAPTGDRAIVERALTRLIRQLLRRLAPREGVQRLEVRFEDREKTAFVVGTVQPTASVRHLVELALTQLEQVRFSGAVHGLKVTAQSVSRLECHQPLLFETAAPRAGRELGELADRLSARLGRERVVKAVLCPDPQPELAVIWQAAGEAAGSGQPMADEDRKGQRSREIPVSGHADRPLWGFRTSDVEYSMRAWPACARPLRLLREPEPIRVISTVPEGPPVRFFRGERVYALTACCGPERIESGWWRNRHVQRDYYRVDTETGQRFWLFRRLSEGDWFLQGEFE